MDDKSKPKSKYQKAKEYLDRIERLRSTIDHLEDAIARDRYEMEHPLSAVTYDRDRVQSSPQGDSMEKHVIKYVEECDKHTKEYVANKFEYLKIIHEAEKIILQLPKGKPRDFLLRHYIDGVSEIEYAFESGYVTNLSVYNLRVRAIKLFSTLL